MRTRANATDKATARPWFLSTKELPGLICTRDDDGAVFEVVINGDKENQKLIVRAVNEYDTLKQNSKEFMSKCSSLTIENVKLANKIDKLLEACKSVMRFSEGDNLEELHNLIEQAVKKAEGK